MSKAKGKVVIVCPNPECQQKLRLLKPGIDLILSVTCPICRTDFRYPFAKTEEETEAKDDWKVLKDNGREYGPIDLITLRQWIEENRVIGDERVFDPSYDGWFLAKEIPQLSDLFEEETLSEEGESLKLEREAKRDRFTTGGR